MLCLFYAVCRWVGNVCQNNCKMSCAIFDVFAVRGVIPEYVASFFCCVFVCFKVAMFQDVVLYEDACVLEVFFVVGWCVNFVVQWSGGVQGVRTVLNGLEPNILPRQNT